VFVQHPFADARLAVTVDGVPQIDREIGRTSVRPAEPLVLPEGTHRLHVLLEAPALRYRAEADADVEVAAGSDAVLRIVPRRTRPPSLDVQIVPRGAEEPVRPEGGLPQRRRRR
jgi:hypothetical protein